MNKRSLINLVKYNGSIYNLYYRFGSFCVRLLGKFVSQKKNRIVFSSFGGRRYDDSPRCIYEAMLLDPRFKDYEFVWALGSPNDFIIPGAKKVKCDSFAYYKVLLSASVWISNSGMERGLSFKPSTIFNLDTWHGSAIKHIGKDQGNTDLGKRIKESHNDIMLAQSKYDISIFSRVFNVPKENFRMIGLPRNDELVNCNSASNRRHIRENLGIKEGKKVLLYAPTFREYDRDENQNCRLGVSLDLTKWERELKEEFVLLIRAHYEVVKSLTFDDNDFVKDVSKYPNLNELMIVSDILISDYSSIFFDYAILNKPMLCFAYDFDRYIKERGLYFDIREMLEGNSNNEDELINAIKGLDIKKAIGITSRFRETFVEEYGNASKLCVDIVWKYLKGEKY